jgi:hypothetical protein
MIRIRFDGLALSLLSPDGHPVEMIGAYREAKGMTSDNRGTGQNMRL